jgi:hypothetical protein
MVMMLMEAVVMIPMVVIDGDGGDGYGGTCCDGHYDDTHSGRDDGDGADGARMMVVVMVMMP